MIVVNQPFYLSINQKKFKIDFDLSGIITASIGTAGDEDYYVYTPTVTGTYTIKGHGGYNIFWRVI
ncbi:MAG TPA: hypothetical protein PK566_17925 [Pseudobacteroides sp.]|nr:hypothetical protein [Pseudobacteroides sp.]